MQSKYNKSKSKTQTVQDIMLSSKAIKLFREIGCEQQSLSYGMTKPKSSRCVKPEHSKSFAFKRKNVNQEMPEQLLKYKYQNKIYDNQLQHAFQRQQSQMKTRKKSKRLKTEKAQRYYLKETTYKQKFQKMITQLNFEESNIKKAQQIQVKNQSKGKLLNKFTVQSTKQLKTPRKCSEFGQKTISKKIVRDQSQFHERMDKIMKKWQRPRRTENSMYKQLPNAFPIILTTKKEHSIKNNYYEKSISTLS